MAWLGFALRCEIREHCTNGEPECEFGGELVLGRFNGVSDTVGELIVCLSPMRYGKDAAADDSRQPLTSELGTRRETESGSHTTYHSEEPWLGMERVVHILRALDSQTLHYFA